MDYIKKFSEFKNLKFLVTGSTGFKGSWLSYWLFNLGAKVVGVGLKPEKGPSMFKILELEKKIKQFYIDINNFKKLNNLIKREKPDAIIHMAAQSIVSSSYFNPLNTLKTNIIGSANVLEIFRTYGAKSLVYITSDKCYLNLDKGRPFNESDVLGGQDNYSSSKACAELIFYSYFQSYLKQNFKLSQAASARAGNVIGGGDFKKNRIVPDIIKSLKLNKKLILHSPNAVRPWQHVLEPLSGYLLITYLNLNKKLSSRIIPNWNFGPKTNNKKKVIEVTKKILQHISKNKYIFYKKNKFHEPEMLSLNINKAKKELKWQPKLTFDDTIKLTADWYSDYLNNKDLKLTTLNQIEFYNSL